jgi:hypothetical protein
VPSITIVAETVTLPVETQVAPRPLLLPVPDELELDDDEELDEDDELEDDELEELDEELDEDELLDEDDEELELELEPTPPVALKGIEHSFTPPATRVPAPKVASLQTKVPLSIL